MNGVLEPQYEAHCVRCEIGALGLGNTRLAAYRELRLLGWANIKGRWHCRECKDSAK